MTPSRLPSGGRLDPRCRISGREAAKTYINNPVALHLRAMNTLYEGLKTDATIVVVPSTALESMQLGGLAGLTALTMGLGQEQVKAQLNGDTNRPAE